MTTIKNYTDINQSRKLAEILPIESADMFHFIHEVDTVGFGYKKDAEEFYSKTEFEYIRCWSLAALLGVLPKKYTELIKEGGMYRIIIKDSYMTSLFDTPIDACVAMIEKLNELKML